MLSRRNALPIPDVKSLYDRIAERYDWQHALLTAKSDERGRRILVEKGVRPGDFVLDAGAGTGSTGLLAAEVAGRNGRVVFFDLSEGMLAKAEEKARRMGLGDRIELTRGDLHHLPYEDDTFDAVLATYSLDPVRDPVKAALELSRVTKPGGRVGVAHLTIPENRILRKLDHIAESLVWHFPALSLGCQPISVLLALETAGGKLTFKKTLGVPLWPFLIFLIEKPGSWPGDT